MKWEMVLVARVVAAFCGVRFAVALAVGRSGKA